VRWTHLGGGSGLQDLTHSATHAPAALTISLRGHVPLTAVHDEMLQGNHNVFINLSLSEGAPVSLMEAQCVGLPVVATDVGGSAEVVPRQLNELVSPSAPLVEICAAVLRAATRPTEESRARRDYWDRQYNAAANYSAWAEELVAAIQSGRL
jgi:colanic acid/amylovoran biosynthesis glycosyltransferase